MAKNPTILTVPIPKTFSSEERERIGELVIDHIIERSKRGKLPDNRTNFVPYSKAYAAFKGVGRSQVDLTLDDIMLNSMNYIDSRADRIRVGYDSGNPEQGKAEGNIRGTYGKARGSKSKARPFLGINKRQLEIILRQVRSER